MAPTVRAEENKSPVAAGKIHARDETQGDGLENKKTQQQEEKGQKEEIEAIFYFPYVSKIENSIANQKEMSLMLLSNTPRTTWRNGRLY